VAQGEGPEFKPQYCKKKKKKKKDRAYSRIKDTESYDSHMQSILGTGGEVYGFISDGHLQTFPLHWSSLRE
jgi:hypothetical protein